MHEKNDLWVLEIKMLESMTLYLKKSQDLAVRLGKSMSVETDGWFSRWLKTQNIHYLKPRGERGDADDSAADK